MIETIMEILQNPWFVGIVGGVLSGVAATWLSRFLFSKRDSREYAQKVAAVNREVIYSVRPAIPEGNIPDLEVLIALTTATCRRYGVTVADAFDVRQISEELVKEVMDSSFISSETKQKYCSQLLAIRKTRTVEQTTAGMIVSVAKNASVESIESLRSKMVKQTSAVTGVMVATLTLFLALSNYRVSSLAEPIKDLLLPLQVLGSSAVAMIGVLVAAVIARVTHNLASKREKGIEAVKTNED